MKRHWLRYGLMIGMIATVLALGGGVLAQDGGTVAFTNLSDGATVSSLTTLVGTVSFPDFLKYEIFLKSGDTLFWVANSHSPVVNGNLARLDPRVFQSGTYQLVVREVHSDSNYTDVTGPTITLENPNGAPLPYYPEVEPSFLYASGKFAVVRAKNCAGEDFFFDYTSPQGSGDAGDILLPGKSGEVICRFSDFTLRPAHYSGTAKGGAQSKGTPIEFDAQAGHVYEIVYLGGGLPATVQEVSPDPMTPAEAPQETPRPTDTPAPAETPAATTEATAAPTATSQPILPTTGDTAGGNVSLFALIAVVLILFLIGGGILAARRRSAS